VRLCYVLIGGDLFRGHLRLRRRENTLRLRSLPIGIWVKKLTRLLVVQLFLGLRGVRTLRLGDHLFLLLARLERGAGLHLRRELLLCMQWIVVVTRQRRALLRYVWLQSRAGACFHICLCKLIVIHCTI
jgi:hypothetical protein